jgi:metal-dependent amidase/aminoacylase/carboxypeptidase family protein
LSSSSSRPSHNLPHEDFGEVQIKSGPFAAGSVGSVHQFRGQTSHAAYPEQGRSPAPAVAELIQDLAALPDSENSSNGIAKLTIIHARIGEPAFGTTPGEAEVMATLRSDREDVLDLLRERVVDRAQEISRANGLEHTHSWKAYPWSEDFGWFTRRFKGTLFGLGAGQEHPALHSPGYDFPDDLIPFGIGLFEGLVERLLG